MTPLAEQLNSIADNNQFDTAFIMADWKAASAEDKTAALKSMARAGYRPATVFEDIDFNHDALVMIGNEIGSSTTDKVEQAKNNVKKLKVEYVPLAVMASATGELPERDPFRFGPTPLDCVRSEKIVIHSVLPTGIMTNEICTACAEHFIRTGEDSKLFTSPDRVRVLMSALLALLKEKGGNDVIVPASNTKH